MYFSSDTIVDGSGKSGSEKHSLLFGYTGTDGYYKGSSPFRTISPNISVTYTNLSFGNTSFKNGTNAGILYPYTDIGTKLNLTLIISNVDYNIIGTDGAPFNSYFSDGNTIIFKGTNNFNTTSNTSGERFSLGYKNIVFDNSSTTNIRVVSNASADVFAGEQGTGALNITLNDNATVSISNGKNSLATSSALTLSVGSNSTFDYNLIPGGGTATTTYLNTSASSSTVINAGNNANLSFESTKTGVTGWGLNGTTTINATSPKQILFSKNNANTSLFTGNNMTVNRLDTNTAFNYQSSTLSSGETATSDYIKYGANSSNTVTATSTSGKTAWVYEPQLAISSLSTSSTVAADQSDLNIGKTFFYSPSDATTNQTNYKVSSKSLIIDSDITSDASQDAITSASDVDLVSSTSLTNGYNYTVNNLTAQTYYVYGQVSGTKSYESNAVGNFTTTSTSKWIEATQIIEKGIYVEFPTTANFSSQSIGEYKSENYTITNHSNTPVTINVTSFSEIQSEFSIVNTLSTGSQYSTTLNLNISSPITSKGLTMNLNNPDTISTVSLSPYTDFTQNYANFNLSGNYSGPLDGAKLGSYKLSFKVQS